MAQYPIHPAAELFPPMSEEEFDRLVADIREHGQRDPIILHDGAVIDGRNRYLACQKIGIEPRVAEWDGEGSIEAFVVSKNLCRRHLNESQRAMIAARLSTLRVGNVFAQKSGVEISTPAVAAEEAGRLLSVSRDSVQYAKTVLRGGTAEEIAAIQGGDAAVSTIAKQIRQRIPPDERKKRRAEPLSQAGKNPERIQRMQINAEIWGRIRDAITHLTSLPRAADVVAIARAQDKTGLVNERVARAALWLMEFEHEWSRRDQDAA